MAEFSLYKVRLAWNPEVPTKAAKTVASIDQEVRSIGVNDARSFAETVHGVGQHYDGLVQRKCIVATHVWEESISDGHVEWLLRWERKDGAHETSGGNAVAADSDGVRADSGNQG